MHSRHRRPEKRLHLQVDLQGHTSHISTREQQQQEKPTGCGHRYKLLSTTWIWTFSFLFLIFPHRRWQKTTKFDMRMWRYRLLVSSFLRCGQRKTWSGHWRTTEGYSVVRQWPDGCQRLTACCQTKVKKRRSIYFSSFKKKEKRNQTMCRFSCITNHKFLCDFTEDHERKKRGSETKKGFKKFQC